jgi:cell division protein FtsB
MEILSQKVDPVRLFWRRVLLVVLLALVLFGISGVWRIYKRERESAVLNQGSTAHLADLIRREAQLRADIANLDTDRGKEAALRQQYQMGKPGEGMIIIVNPPTPAPVAPTSTPLVQWFKNFLPWW